jgi:hypothetical protein
VTHIDTERRGDFAAINYLFRQLDETAEANAKARRALAVEVGFEPIHPRQVQIGDRIRTGTGNWYEVDDVVYYESDDPGMPSYWRISHDGGFTQLCAQTETHPYPPVVIREVTAPSEPF